MANEFIDFIKSKREFIFTEQEIRSIYERTKKISNKLKGVDDSDIDSNKKIKTNNSGDLSLKYIPNQKVNGDKAYKYIGNK